METLSRRLDRVERENRRLKLTEAVVLAGILAVVLIILITAGPRQYQ